MDPAFIQYLGSQRHLLDYFYVAPMALLIYENLLTIDREIDLVWKSAWSYTKVLFLLTRYIPYIYSILALNDQLAVDVTRALCVITYPASAWLIMFAIYISEVIMCIRTWALWGRDLRIGVGLITMMTVCLVAQCVVMAKFSASLVIQPAPFQGFRGCFVTGAGSILGYTFVIWLIVDVIVLALIAVSALRTYRLGDPSRLLRVIHRDGIMFYVYLLVLTICNVIVGNVLSGGLKAILGPAEGTFYSILTSRIILNIRETAYSGPNDTEIELHTQQEVVVRDRANPGDDAYQWVHKGRPYGGGLFSA